MLSINGKARLLSVTLGILGAAVAAHADISTFTPDPVDLDGLDHHYYYSWGIDYTLPTNQTITSATLTIKNIYDWQVEDGDNLYLTLLDGDQNVAKGVTQFFDNMEGGDDWLGKGLSIADYSDPEGGSPRNFDLVVNFDGASLVKLNQLAATNSMALGFDPDCHYFNDGIKLKITTSPAPEPISFATLGLGIIGIIRRRRNRK